MKFTLCINSLSKTMIQVTNRLSLSEEYGPITVPGPEEAPMTHLMSASQRERPASSAGAPGHEEMRLVRTDMKLERHWPATESIQEDGDPWEVGVGRSYGH